MLSFKDKVKAWLQIVRVPNLFTIPGDVLVGYLACRGELSGRALPLAITLVISLYVVGLLGNDIADLKEDSNSRPGRPIPRGAISVKEAAFVMLLLSSFALSFSYFSSARTFASVIVLLAAVHYYNFFTRRGTLFSGPVILAVCRILGVMIGVSASGKRISADLIFAGYILCELIHIFSLSMAAAKENGIIGRKLAILVAGGVFLAPFILIAGAFATLAELLPYTGEAPPAFKLGILAWGAAAFFSANAAWKLARPKDGRNHCLPIGMLIRNLILLQASACAFTGNSSVALWLVAAFIASQLSSKFFYQT